MKNAQTLPHGSFNANSKVDNDNPLSYYNGEALRGEGSLSAPPPPGFNTESHEERVRIANQAIWTDAGMPANWSVDTRTTSFSNLAAMVGTGLAESMEDSTQDSRRDGMMLYDLSYARQSRHAASRLLGCGSSGLSPTAALLDLTFPVHSQKRLSDSSLFFNSNTQTPGDRREPPSALPPYSPHGTVNDPMEDFRSSVQHRNQQLPTGMFHNSRPTEVGVTVMEPDMGRKSAPPELYGEQLSSHGTPATSRQGTPELSDLHREMQAMNLENRSVQSGGDISVHSATEAELEPFLWDVNHAEPSRSIAILRAGNVPVSDVRSTCEAFGVLELFRAEFADRGIILVGYYDIRAQYAAVELKENLRRLSSSYAVDVEVKFCVPLKSSSPHDESIIVLSDLPHNLSERSLMSMLNTYGAIRSLRLQAGTHYGGGSYVVEFHNVQDAKQALLELESSQPWGPNVMVEVGTRRAVDRRKGRELLAVIGSWRHSNWPSQHTTNNFTSVHLGQSSTYSATGDQYGAPLRHGRGLYPDFSGASTEKKSPSTMRSDSPPFVARDYQFTGYRSDPNGNPSTLPQQTTQLVLGPDGRYSYVVVNHSAFPPPRQARSPHHQVDPRAAGRHLQPHLVQQQVMQVPHGTFMAMSPKEGLAAPPYWSHPPQHHQQQQLLLQQYQNSGGPAVPRGPAYATDGGSYSQSTTSAPFYTHVAHNSQNQTDSSISSGSGSMPGGSNTNGGNPNHGGATLRRHQALPAVDDKDNRHLTLDIDSVQAGQDSRTSLMVRNIPNKYTQQMLLAEFSENGHGPGKIDFFYLPIDFKNKCNRGYAFVNFVDFKDIIPFHRQYFGQHWRVFNSDKICDITYARIQGKASMLKRFENSALMEKDEEYKPLVFVSHGMEKGKRIPFPTDTSR